MTDCPHPVEKALDRVAATLAGIKDQLDDAARDPDGPRAVDYARVAGAVDAAQTVVSDASALAHGYLEDR